MDLPKERLKYAAATQLDSAEAGKARRAGLADMTDAALRRIWDDGIEKVWGSATEMPGHGLAFAAVGSHARRDAGPCSDLDLLLLHDGRTVSADDLSAFADTLWYPLWDSKVRLDHAVRSIDMCQDVAEDDLPAAVGLLTVRHLAGDVNVTTAVGSAASAQWRRRAKRRLPELFDAIAERTSRCGELAYLIEPDLKEARGGLRDVVALRAIVASWAADMPHAEVTGAYERLLDVRDALHIATGRADDRLILADQDAVALGMGMADADVLLARVSESARRIAFAMDTTTRRARGALAARRIGKRRPQLRPLAEGLVEHQGELCLAAGTDPSRNPLLAFRAAAHAASNGLPLSPVTAQNLAKDCPLPAVPWSRATRESFVRTIASGEPLVGIWEALDQVGLTTAWIPQWGDVRNRPQRTIIHRHTVDRHQIQTCVEAASRLAEVKRPDVLIVTALLHDIGKVPGNTDHSVAGAPVARKIALRMGFEKADADDIERLVLHHLTLAELATKRDPDDPQTVTDLVNAVDGREDLLDALVVLTASDARAAGPAAWTSWRQRLVNDLVRRARVVLSGADAPAPAPLSDTESYLVKEVLADEQIRISVTQLDDLHAVTVVAPDRIGLVSDCAGVLASQALQVRSALVRTIDGIAVDTWWVRARNTRADAALIRQDLSRLARGDDSVLERLRRRDASWRSNSSDPESARVFTLHQASAEATVLEVRAEDRPALLHSVAQTLRAMKTNIRSAHITTHAGRAVDVVYIVESDPDQPEYGSALSAARTAEVIGALLEMIRKD